MAKPAKGTGARKAAAKRNSGNNRDQKKRLVRRQAGVVPVRAGAGGSLEVMLLTSRDTGRWVIPKGWPMRKLAPSAAAAREAYEEAGLVGEIAGEEPVGSFRYAKRLKNGKEATCLVTVFLLKVQRQLETWPECGQRQTKWFDISGAAAAGG